MARPTLDSRREARYVIMWQGWDQARKIRCSWPTIQEAVDQAGRYPEMKPVEITDMRTGEMVWNFLRTKPAIAHAVDI